MYKFTKRLNNKLFKESRFYFVSHSDLENSFFDDKNTFYDMFKIGNVNIWAFASGSRREELLRVQHNKLKSIILSDNKFWKNIESKYTHCIRNDRLDILMEISKFHNSELFVESVKNKNIDITEFYSKMNLDNSYISQKISAIDLSDFPLEIVQILANLKISVSNKSIINAVKNNNTKVVTELLKCGADPNLNNGELIIHCCENGYVATLSKLLQSGGDPNIQNGICLLKSISKQYKICASLLIKYGANSENYDVSDIDTKNNKYEDMDISKELNREDFKLFFQDMELFMKNNG